MKKIRQVFSKDPETRDQAVMSVGAMASMALNFPSLIILSRIYGPAVSGVYAAFLSLNSLCLIPATLRLEMAIQSPKDEGEAVDLAALAWLCALAFAVILTIALLIFRDHFVRQYGPSIKPFLVLSPLLLVSSTCILVMSQLMIREGRFFWFAIINFSQTVLSITLKFSMIPLKMHTNPLIWAELISQWFIGFLLISNLQLIKRVRARHKSIKSLIGLIKEYKEFPRDVLPASWIETLNSQLPVLILTRYMGETTVGHYARAMQFLSLPTQIFGTPISSTFRNSGARAYRETGDCRMEFKRTGFRLLSFALVVFPLAALIFPSAISFLLGPEWKEAGVVGQPAAIYAFFGFIAAPLSTMLFIAKKTTVNLGWIILTLCCNATALWIGVQSKSLVIAILYWAISYSAMYVLVIGLSYRFAKSSEKSLESPTG